MRAANCRTFVFIFASLTLLASCGKDSSKSTQPAPEIPIASVVKQDVPVPMELVGQLIGSLDISIRARVEGTLEEMHFAEGQPVKKDQLLYSIDSRPFEAKLVEAQSRSAEAKTLLAKAKSDLKRIRPLAKMNAVSQRDLDAAIAQEGAASASVDAADAAVDFSKIELSYTKILAPIDGLIGISEAKVGDFVGKPPNPVVLNVVSQIDPIHVRVSLSESDYLKLARRTLARTGLKQLDQYEEIRKSEADQRPGLELYLADGSLHPHRGILKVVNSQVDSSTGTLTMEAAFPNPEKILRPGQFARIRAVTEIRKDALLLPSRAVQELQGTFSVFVVGPDNKVEMKQVTPGPKVGKLIVIESGISEADKVVLEGQQKLRPGMEVRPIEEKAPATSESMKPAQT
ncbi:MAG: efflux RND transporter periplasmic adaptor subunit [Bdellovibrionales bacterium]|nr:efflux RND transporter periplasmic adaptor subunit [Bdellovibrionales bacterium]